jgi:hypothetical protein
VFSYLDDNYDSMGLKEDEVDIFETWYNVVSYGLFGLFAIEICRFR